MVKLLVTKTNDAVLASLKQPIYTTRAKTDETCQCMGSNLQAQRALAWRGENQDESAVAVFRLRTHRVLECALVKRGTYTWPLCKRVTVPLKIEGTQCLWILFRRYKSLKRSQRQFWVHPIFRIGPLLLFTIIRLCNSVISHQHDGQRQYLV